MIFQALTPNNTENKSAYSTMRETVNSVLTDMDPDQGVEDEYKKKNDTIFCWRFLR